MTAKTNSPRLRAADVKVRVTLRDVAALYHLDMQPAGQQRLRCRCVCGQNRDRNPSFFLFEDDQHYHCFACNAHGDIFGLVQLIERCDFRTAFGKLRNGFNLHPVTTGQPASPRRIVHQPATAIPQTVSNSVRQLLSATTDWYQRCLWQQPKMLAQLRARGLSDPTIQLLKLGYAPGEGLARALFETGANLGLLPASGLIHPETGREHFRERLMFPVPGGDITLFLIGRSTGPQQQPKYLGLSDGAAHKSPMQMGQALDGSIITEGAVDFAALVEWGLHERYLCIGLLGTAHRSALERLLPTLKAPVLLALDQDMAGKRAALQLAQALRAHGIAASIALDVDRPSIAKSDDESLLMQTITAEGFARIVHWRGAKDLGDLLINDQLGQAAFRQALSQQHSKGGEADEKKND